MKVLPGEAYLPAGIDASGKLSWPTAAAGVPGLLWIDARYRGVLRVEAGRFGARAFFGALGAEVAPRLVEPDNAETQRGVTLNRRLPDAGGMQDDAMERVPDFWPTHLRGELISPDLDRVIAAIVALPVRKRRDRAEALLSTMAEHWRLDYEPYATAEAFHFYRTWVSDGPVPTAWLSRLGSEPWLSNQARQPRSPRQLWVRSARNLDVFGDSTKHYGAELTVLAGRYDAFLEALGVTVEPHASQIIEALQDLQKSAPEGDRAAAESAAALYDALAEHCARIDDDVRRDALVDDMRVDAVRGKFGIGKGRGLVLADGKWRTPQAVFRGKRIFGSLRPFVPERKRADRLWEVLDVDLPTITDCLSVLDEIAMEPPDGKAEAVLISTYRHLATLSPQRAGERDGLVRVPLWSGSEWIRTRPIFAVDDPVLGASLAERLPTWVPPVALDSLGALPSALGVTVLDQTQFTAVGLNEEGVDRGTALLPMYRAAVGHLRARLIRRDPDTLESLKIGWPALESARVVVTADLGVEVRIRDQPEFSIPIGAHVHRAPSQLAVCFASLEDVDAEETGGRAIASLFTGDGSRVDREKVALLWSSAWRAASAGEVADDVDFADEADDEEDPLSGLADELRANIRRPKQWRGGPPARPGAPPPSAGRSAPPPRDPLVQEPLPLRRLKTLDRIVVLGVEVTPGEKRTRRKRGSGDGLVDPPAGTGDAGTKGSGGAGRAYTDAERETLAVEVLRRLLQTDKRVLRDLRSVGRLGADVVDDLKRYFEIKSASGEMPDTVDLQVSQVRRSVEQRSGTWFLAVVSGLEDGFETRVRFIADPLKNLTWVEKGSLTFTGIRSAQAIDAVLG